jgi:hypothetical protein
MKNAAVSRAAFLFVAHQQDAPAINGLGAEAPDFIGVAGCQ